MARDYNGNMREKCGYEADIGWQFRVMLYDEHKTWACYDSKIKDNF